MQNKNMHRPGTKKTIKILKRIFNALQWIVTLSVLFFAVSNLAEILTGNPDFNITHTNVYVIVSGSMSTVNEANEKALEGKNGGCLQVYDLVAVKKLDDSDSLEIGDIVTYISDGVCVIHRIASIDGEGENAVYHLRGDANNTDDPYEFSRDDITGKYLFRIPVIGIVGLYIKSYFGIATILVCVGLKLVSDYMKITFIEENDPLFYVRKKNAGFCDD